MTKNEKFLRRWQHILRLDDWDIKYKEKKKFKHPRQTGWTVPIARFHTAEICIKKHLPRKDFEKTVVHELLHVKFPSMLFEDGTQIEHELEVGIEDLAKTLLGRK